MGTNGSCSSNTGSACAQAAGGKERGGLRVDFVSGEPIRKDWSGDQKYRVTDQDGILYLLRASDIQQYDRKKAGFRMLKQAAALGIPMCRPDVPSQLKRAKLQLPPKTPWENFSQGFFGEEKGLQIRYIVLY